MPLRVASRRVCGDGLLLLEHETSSCNVYCVVFSSHAMLNSKRISINNKATTNQVQPLQGAPAPPRACGLRGDM
eukprot:565355-Prymnesium_polylepis.1